MNGEVVALVAVLVLCFICFVVGAGIGMVAMDETWESESVAAKHARYYLDETGRRQWEWLPVEGVEDD